MIRVDQDAAQLRQKAETQLACEPNPTRLPTDKLLHELQVHQIELEMQNEQLRETQIELEKSRDRYVNFYDFAPVGYITLNHLGLIDEINLTGATLLQEERSKLLNRRFALFISTADRDRWHNHFLNALTYKESLSCELALRRDESQPFYVRLDSMRINTDDRKSAVRIVLTDITVRKQIEEQLHRTEESFRLMVESVTDYAIVMLNAEGRIASWNSGAQRIMGYSAAEIVGQHFSRFYPHEDIAHGTAQRELDIAAEQGRFETEGWRLRKNGALFLANVVITAVRGEHGNLRGFAKLTRDMTEHKRLERILLDKNFELENAKSAAEKANLAKSDFLSSMSHELRSPLNAILGFAQLLEAGSPPHTATQVVRLNQIIKAGWYLLELINEILDLSVIESGRLLLLSEPVSLADVLRECQAMIEPIAQKRGIQLTFHSFDHLCFANADRTRVKQVLINLLSNAIKYNREQGTVEVTCVAHTPERIRVSIKDSGAGLSEEKMEQLFQPFNRLGQESGGVEGTGIGLVVTKQLIELMGGSIGVESEIGVGSEFWFELNGDIMPPSAAKHAILAPVELGPPPPGKRGATHPALCGRQSGQPDAGRTNY